MSSSPAVILMPSRPLPDLDAPLATIMRDLRLLYEPCEQDCLFIGQQLSQARSTVRSLTATAGDLVGMFNADWLLSTIVQLEQDLQSLNRLLSDRSEQNLGLQRIDQAAADIQRALTDQGKIISHVKMLSINARIEAALVADLGIDFSVFTREIGSLVTRGSDTVRNILLILQELRTLLARSISLQVEFHGQHRTELDAINRRLTGAVQALHARQDSARQTIDQLSWVLRQTDEAIGRVVSGLQVGDMIRQRLEHIEQAVDTVARVLKGEQVDQPLSMMQVGRLCHLVSQLQIHQVQAIRQELDDRVADVEQNLRRLGDLMEGVQEQVHALHGADRQDHGGFLLDMERDLKQTETILEHYRRARQETDESLLRVRGMADAMSRTLHAIHDIDAEMHLIGLNASLKCGSIGTRGRSLNVVAGELQSSARQTRTTAAQISGQLGVISQETLLLESHEKSSDGVLIGHLDKVLRSSIDSLDQVGSSSSRDLTAIQQQARDLTHFIDKTLQTFTLRPRLQAGLKRVLFNLEEVERKTASYPCEGDPRDEQQTLLAFLRDHYTMLSERGVHAALLGEDLSEMPHAPEPAPGSTGGDDVDISGFLF